MSIGDYVADAHFVILPRFSLIKKREPALPGSREYNR
jgi:hypothetical protein